MQLQTASRTGCTSTPHTLSTTHDKKHFSPEFSEIIEEFLMWNITRTYIGRRNKRSFSTILSTGEKVEREMSMLEREIVNVKEANFSKLGLYNKRVTDEGTLYKLFQMAQPNNKTDYSACVYAMNHFYNFGVQISHHDFTNRWLSVAVETGRVDEAVSIVKLWNTWLPCPPRIELVESLMGMVKLEQSRDLLKSIRENWRIPLSSRAYTIVISKEIANASEDEQAVMEAYRVWKDAVEMNVVLPRELGDSLAKHLADAGKTNEADSVNTTMVRWGIY
jgi:hypothetical protein